MTRIAPLEQCIRLANQASTGKRRRRIVNQRLASRDSVRPTVHDGLFLIGFVEQEYLFKVGCLLQAEIDHLTVLSHASDRRTFGDSAISIRAESLARASTVAAAFPNAVRATLDSDLLKRFATHRIQALRSLDRVLVKPLSIRKAETYLHVLLEYWMGFLETTKRIDAAIFASIPHLPWDIVLDFALSEAGIPRRYIRETLLDRVVYIGADFDGFKASAISFKDSDTFLAHPSLSAEIELEANRELARIRARSNNVQKPSLAIFLRGVFSVLAHTARRRLNGGETNYFGPQYLRLQGLKVIRVLWARYRNHAETLRWLRRHSTNSISSSNRRFILFTLHMQPEKTTIPESGDFSHQYLAISILSRALPAGIEIVIKEHPAQFKSQSDIRKTHARDADFYARIVQLPNVRFAETDSDSRLLAKQSIAVASCRGSILWESLLLGRPSLSFAPTWHSSCTASPVCSSVADVEEALSRLQDFSSDDVKASVADFLSRSQNNLVRASFEHDQWESAGRPSEDVRNLAMALAAAVSVTIPVS